MKKKKGLCALLVFILVVTMSGCSISPKPFEYRPDNELKKGSGLFSGEAGAFTIYRKPATPEKVSKAGEKNEQTNY